MELLLIKITWEYDVDHYQNSVNRPNLHCIHRQETSYKIDDIADLWGFLECEFKH